MLKRFSIPFLSALLFSAICCAQQLQLYPDVLIKGTPYFSAIATSNEGGYYFASLMDHVNGVAGSNLNKVDASGNLITSFQKIIVDNHILKVEELGDGKILISGWFKNVNGIATGTLVRLNADGTIDDTFAKPIVADSEVIETFIVQPSGKIVIAGNFTLAGYTDIARLNADGTLDTSFEFFNSTSVIGTIASDADGNIYFPYFSQLMKLDVDGNSIPSWPVITIDLGSLSSIEVFQNKIFLGGQFDTIANVPRKSLGVINTDGSVNDLTISNLPLVLFMKICPDGRIVINDGNNVLVFDPTGVLIQNIVNVNPNKFVIDSNSNILVTGGDALAASNQRHPFTVRFKSDLSLDNVFHCEVTYADGIRKAITADANGRILIGGYSGVAEINSSPKKLIRLNPSGDVDATFDPAVSPLEGVHAIAVQGDQKVLVSTGYSIMRLLPQGALDNDFQQLFPGSSQFFTAIRSHGEKAYISGRFDAVNNAVYSSIMRLNLDGSIDGSFNSGLPFDSYIIDFEFQSDGKIILGGIFPFADGSKCIVRLNEDGSIDESFLRGTSTINASQDISIDSQDRIYFGGDFQDYNGTGFNRLVRLEKDGQLDFSFVPTIPFANGPNSVELAADDEIIIGTPTWYTASGLAVLNSSGDVIESAFDSLTSTIHGTYAKNGSVFLAGRFVTQDLDVISSLATYRVAIAETITTLQASYHADSVATLTWSSNASAAWNFIIERSIGNDTSFEVIDTVTSEVSGFVDASANTTDVFFYRVKPVNEISEGNYSNIAVLLGKLQALPATDVGASSFTANWVNREFAQYYTIQISIDTFQTILNEVQSSDPFINLSSFNGLTVYAYRVSYSDGNAVSLFSNTIHVKTKPNTPGNVQAAAMSQNEIKLKWTSYPPLAARIIIERSMNAIGPFEVIVDLKGTVDSYTDASLEIETIYYYRLKCVDDSLESDYTPIVFAGTKPPMSQLISFKPIPAKIVGNPAFALSASASSGLEIVFTSSDPEIVSITGSTATILHAGSVIITAMQAGNAQYLPAVANQPVTINKALQTIAFQDIPEKHSAEDPFTLTATASSQLPIEFVSSDETVASISGNIVTITGAGEVQITAKQAGNIDYYSSEVSKTLVVHLITEIETSGLTGQGVFPNPGSGTYTIELGEFSQHVNSSLYFANGTAAEGQISVADNKMLLDISHLADGLYILLLRDDKKIRQLKIVKQ
jgi:uncharacterized delta-60 repeat protein